MWDNNTVQCVVILLNIEMAWGTDQFRYLLLEHAGFLILSLLAMMFCEILGAKGDPDLLEWHKVCVEWCCHNWCTILNSHYCFIL